MTWSWTACAASTPPHSRTPTASQWPARCAPWCATTAGSLTLRGRCQVNAWTGSRSSCADSRATTPPRTWCGCSRTSSSCRKPDRGTPPRNSRPSRSARKTPSAISSPAAGSGQSGSWPDAARHRASSATRPDAAPQTLTRTSSRSWTPQTGHAARQPWAGSRAASKPTAGHGQPHPWNTPTPGPLREGQPSCARFPPAPASSTGRTGSELRYGNATGKGRWPLSSRTMRTGNAQHARSSELRRCDQRPRPAHETVQHGGPADPDLVAEALSRATPTSRPAASRCSCTT